MTRRKLDTPLAGIENRHQWQLLGQHGAIELSVIAAAPPTGIPAALAGRSINGRIWTGHLISVHSPRPGRGLTGVASDDCHILEGPCYNDAGFGAADDLVKRWIAADGDDDLIWQELEHLYADRLQPAVPKAEEL